MKTKGGKQGGILSSHPVLERTGGVLSRGLAKPKTQTKTQKQKPKQKTQTKNQNRNTKTKNKTTNKNKNQNKKPKQLRRVRPGRFWPPGSRPGPGPAPVWGRCRPQGGPEVFVAGPCLPFCGLRWDLFGPRAGRKNPKTTKLTPVMENHNLKTQ